MALLPSSIQPGAQLCFSHDSTRHLPFRNYEDHKAPECSTDVFVVDLDLLIAWFLVWNAVLSCETLYSQMCVILTHAQSTEFTTAGILTRSQKYLKDYKKDSYLRIIWTSSEFIPKCLNTNVNVIFQFLLINKCVQESIILYILSLWYIEFRLMREKHYTLSKHKAAT